MRKNCLVLSKMHDVLLSVNDSDTWLRYSTYDNDPRKFLNEVIYLGWRGIRNNYSSCNVSEDILFAFEI